MGYNSDMNTTLIRVEPDKHMDRRYSISVQATLLDPVAVVCIWGSRRSSYQRVQIIPVATSSEATTRAEKIVRKKLQRGYRPD